MVTRKRNPASTLLLAAVLAIFLWVTFRSSYSLFVTAPHNLPLQILADREVVPTPLAVFPLADYQLPETYRLALLTQVTDWSHRKLSSEGVIVHALRLRRLARLSELNGARKSFYEQLLESVLDDRRYQVWAPGFPLLYDTQYGACYRTSARGPGKMIGGIPHVDKVLSTLGELGVGLSTDITTHGGQCRQLADVLQDSLCRWHPDRENEWTLIAYCTYLTTQRKWVDANGVPRSIDDVLRAVLGRTTVGPCFGIHRWYGLAKACMRARQTPGFFEPTEVQKAETVLQSICAQLVSSQHPSGYWDPQRVNASGVPWIEGGDLDDPRLRLVVTGHLLEWFAIVDQDLRPPPDSIRKAANYLEHELRHNSDSYLGGSYLTPSTHAIRALFHLSGIS